jgi:UDPglucose 6-dehydrogenase
MKVTFFNQLYDAVEDEKLTCSPLSVLRTVAKEPRIGTSHWRVPGSDGKRGFGGACFPKDVSALLGYTDKLSILEKVMEVNNIYRKGYDLDEREKLANVHFLTEKKETLTVDDVIDDDQLDLFGEQS